MMLRSGRLPQEAGLILVIGLLATLLTFASEPISMGGHTVNNFLRLDNIIPNVATPLFWMAIMAVGVTAVIASGNIDISVGSIYGLSALGAAAALQRLDENASGWLVVPVAVIVPLAIGLVCGLLNGLIVVGLRVHSFIATLGTLSIFRGLALVLVPQKTLPYADRTLPVAFTDHFVAWQLTIERAGLPELLLQPVPMVITLLVVAAGWTFLSHMVAGRHVMAIGGNEEAARFAGIQVGRVKLLVFALSGLCAGIAGMVSAGYYRSASTNTGEGYELFVIAAAVVGGASLTGGRGTALGALLGALTIKLIEHGIVIIKKLNLGFAEVPVSKEYTKIIVGIAIVLAVATDRLAEYARNRRLARRV